MYQVEWGWKHLQDQSNQEWKSHSPSSTQQSRGKRRSTHCFYNTDFICFHQPRNTPSKTDKMQRFQIVACVSILHSLSFPPSLFSIASLHSQFLSIHQKIETAYFQSRSLLFLFPKFNLLFQFDYNCYFFLVI